VALTAPAPTRVNGTLVVLVLLTVVAAVAGGLIWYKRRPQLQTLPFTLDTPTGKMYLVPAGQFLHGPNAAETAMVPAFYIDATEVTNATYARFCRETGRALPPGFPTGKPLLPVVNVNIEDADAFARWAGKRLPDALEWEKAARGTRGPRFPWGDAAEPRRANVAGSPSVREPGLLPADSMPQHASPSRALHMAGNAAELVRTTVKPDQATFERFAQLMRPPPARNESWFSARGGSWLRPIEDASVSSYIAVPGRYRAPDIGFRCARDPVR
jgi:formylglycine-generating enzyme required for sulfatase activity